MATDNESTDPDDFRRRIYEAMDDPELSLAEKRVRALSLGREYLDVENGHINRLTGTETFETVASVGGGVEMVPTGETLDRANTYCRRTVEASSPIALSNAPEQGWGDDPAYREFGLECYLGTTIFVRGDLYGTLCFASRSVRNAAFTVGEKTFVELIARLLGREIEAARHDRELEARDRALERSENKYQALLQAAPDAILLVDADTGEIVGANEKAVELTGYAGAELEAMRVAELVPEERRERYAEFLRDGIDETCRERFDDGVSLRIRRAGGSDVPVEVSGSTVEVNDMNVVQTVVRDISDRRERAQELERSRELLRQTQNAVNLGGWEVDLRTESLNWTDEVYRIYDLPVESDLTVEEAMEFFHPEDRPEVEDAFERVETEGETYNLEVRLVTASDEVRWVRTIGLPQYDDSGDDVVAVQGVFQDISDRKERERDLRINNRAVEEASVGIAISDATVEELPVLYANREFERLTGYDSETVLGRSPGFLHGPETDQAAVESVREALDSHEPVTTELLHYRADGMPFWDELTVTPVTDEHGDVPISSAFTGTSRRRNAVNARSRCWTASSGTIFETIWVSSEGTRRSSRTRLTAKSRRARRGSAKPRTT
jgi:PAS domain S-box-containing protein